MNKIIQLRREKNIYQNYIFVYGNGPAAVAVDLKVS